MSAETSERDAAHNRETIVHLGAMLSEIFTQCAQEAERSIVEGSELTGAPGQPVGQYGPGYHDGEHGGYLKASWQLVHESPDVAVIGTNTDYAESIEDGLSYAHGGTPMQLRSTVGGFHSVKLTVAGFDRIVDAVKARVMKGGA